MLPILKHELKYYFKNAHELIYIYGFYALVLLIIPMGLRGYLHEFPELIPSLLWLAIAGSILPAAMTLFQRDSDSGFLEIYGQLPQGLGGIVLAKWTAFTLAMAIPAVTMAPMMLLAANLPLEQAPAYMMASLAGCICLTIISSLAAVITVGLDRARAVVLLIVLPLIIPVTIFGSEYLRHPEQLWQPQLLFLIAFSIFLLPVLCLAGTGCIRANH